MTPWSVTTALRWSPVVVGVANRVRGNSAPLFFRQNAARSPVCGIFRFALFITVFGTTASIVKSVLQFLWCLSAAPAR